MSDMMRAYYGMSDDYDCPACGGNDGCWFGSVCQAEPDEDDGETEDEVTNG